jgi:5'-nucleotidase
MMAGPGSPEANLGLTPEDRRPPSKRIFVNRSLTLEKIKFYGFDMDYTLAEYKSPEYEDLGFELLKNRLIEIGYPAEISNFKYKPGFPVRGIWWDSLHGNMLKVDGFGNILFCCHGLKFLKSEEIAAKYPNNSSSWMKSGSMSTTPCSTCPRSTCSPVSSTISRRTRITRR